MVKSILLRSNKIFLFIDGENFLHKVKEVLKEESIAKDTLDLALIDLDELFKEPLKGFNIAKKIFYVSRLHIHPETKKKSLELIKFQRKLRNNLIKQGYEFVIAGNVRAQKIGDKIVFETNPNKGLSYTTNRIILLRNPEVVEVL